MKLDSCKICEYHNAYVNGQILCKYSNGINSMATYEDKNAAVIFVIGCPKDR